jgi:serine phosphatase RsbU (regulator of sigma subunit)/Tfp pilus assembly protein PilF
VYHYTKKKLAQSNSKSEIEKLNIYMAMSLSNYGFLHQQQPYLALKYFKQSAYIYHKLIKTDPSSFAINEGLATTYNNIASILDNQGDIELALNYFEKSLTIRERIQDKEGLALSFRNIAIIHYNQGEYDIALNYLLNSLKISEEIGSNERMASVYHGIGLIYSNKNDFDNAIEYCTKSLKIRIDYENKPAVANSYDNIGKIYFKQGDFTQALENYKKSLALYKEIGDKEGMASSYCNIGNLRLKKNENNLAILNGKKSLDYSQEIGYPDEIRNAAQLLSKAYEYEGNHKESLNMYKLFINMRDSTQNEETLKASTKQQVKYEYEKQKALDDADNDKKISLEKEKQKKQFVVLVIIIVASCLVLLLLLIIYRRLRITKKQKIIIEEQKEVVELAHKETQVQKEIIEEAHKEITDSINYAERIQRSFLATEDLLNENLNDYFVFFQPKEAVSGDFYWAGKLANNNFAMVNADSTGHGVPGAIMSILNISSIEKAVEKGLISPSEIFNDTRKTIIERLKKDGSTEGGKDGMDASIIIFDKDNDRLSYTAAQNPIWIVRNKEIIQIKPEKMPIGKFDNDSTPFVGGEIAIQKGDVIYTLTDGYQDQFGGPKAKKFMIKKMREYILSIAHLPIQEQHQKIKDTFNNWKGDLEQIDDVCVIGVRV